MTIDLVIPTWPNHPRRIEYFSRVVQSLLVNLYAFDHAIRYVVSAESERDPESTWHGDELAELCKEQDLYLHWREGPASLGGAMNTASRLSESPLYILWQDDFVLLEPLNIDPTIHFMTRHPEVAMHRFSYFTDPVDGTKFRDEQIQDGFRLVDIDGTWPYGDDPHIKHRSFENTYGPYLEGGRHGMSEGEMLFRLVKMRAIITAGMKSYCGHIGSVAAVPKSQEYRQREVSR